MAEGWLFRLRTSLGSQYSAPAWPTVREIGADPAAPRGLRQPGTERGRDAEEPRDPGPSERET